MPAPVDRRKLKIVRADLWSRAAATRSGWEWKLQRALGAKNPLTMVEGRRDRDHRAARTVGKIVRGPNDERIGVPITWAVEHFTVEHPVEEGRWRVLPLIPKLLRYAYRVGQNSRGDRLYSTILSVGERGKRHEDRLFATYVHDYDGQLTWGSTHRIGQKQLERTTEARYPEIWRLKMETGRRNPAPTPLAAGVKRPDRTPALYPHHSRSGAPGARPPARRAVAAGLAIAAIAAIVALAGPQSTPTSGGMPWAA
jgi:hypothetical protein